MSQPILIDESVFDEAFIPERLVCREGQMKEIARCLGPLRNGKSARNMFINGPPGTGKTSVCQWILKEHFQNKSVFVNCWSKRTSHKIMQEILQQLGQVIHGRESGSELTRRFEKMKRRIAVCLDESDHISEPDILYDLARSSCSLMLISNQKSPLQKADPRIKSSLLLHEIEFKPYSAEEIREILRQRASYGIRPGAVDASLLSLASRLCNGDARVALQSLMIAAKEAESRGNEKIAVEDLKYAIKCSRKYRLSYLLGKLNEHQRTVFEILTIQKRMTSGELYAEYLRNMKNPLVSRSYRNHMQKMMELGLVKEKGTGRWKVYEIAI